MGSLLNNQYFMESKGPPVFLTGPLFLAQTTTQRSVMILSVGRNPSEAAIDSGGCRFLPSADFDPWRLFLEIPATMNQLIVWRFLFFICFHMEIIVGLKAGFLIAIGMFSSLQAVELFGRPLPEVLFHCCPARQRGAYARPSIHIISCLWCGPSRKTRKVWLDIQTLPKMVH